MDIREIKLVYSTSLSRNLILDKGELPDREFSKINNIGIPKIVLDKFKPNKMRIQNGILIFSKSYLSDIYLGINMQSQNVICFSEMYNSNSFMNSDYESFIKTNFAYETFRSICITNQIFGPYYDNTPQGGNFEKYANLLKELIQDIDERSANEGVWHSLIEEMSMGVI
jgi:hypothetical protein